MKKRIALAGNPNSGKTTIFNTITGSRQRVGNYPGVTVERKEGTRRYNGYELHVSDVPGMYSLTPNSIDEQVARDDLIDNPPDVVVDIIDSTNLERNLYLAIQLLELGIPVILAFNMSDLASERGLEFDLEKLSRTLGAPVVQTVGHKSHGIEALLDAVVTTGRAMKNGDGFTLDYGREVEAQIAQLQRVLEKPFGHLTPRRRRWMALRLLENDSAVLKNGHPPEVLAELEAASHRLREQTAVSPEVTITSRRYDFIASLCRDTVRGSTTDERTARIDRVFTHRLFGLPIFLGLMYLVFQLTFTLASPMADGIESGLQWMGTTLVAVWPWDADGPLLSLLVDGIIGGVGGVLVFLPNIILLFTAIAILEDSGYMARAAFLMDRLMSRVGLHGKSFIPMLIGFGCNVPAIMATRTLESRRDRMTTMLILPLMSCSARLTIYALIIPAFFITRWQGPVLWLMYVLGIGIAIAAANILRSTVFKGESAGFLMEMPPYHLPAPRSIVTHTWERAWIYLRKAGTIILGISIILWALTTFPKKPAVDGAPATLAITGEVVTAPGSEEEQRSEQLAYSIAGRLGHAMEPALRPIGFDWRIGTALVGAFAAKEVFVAQMGIVFSAGEVDETSGALREKLRSEYSPLVGFCILLFTLIAAPCMATVAIMKRESNSWTWAFAQFGSLTALAYVLTLIVYQAGRFLGIGI